MGKVILVDPERCINCKACQVACKEWNDTGYEDLENVVAYADLNIPPAITPNTWTRLIVKEGVEDEVPYLHFAKTQCMHCGDAACEKACPTGATYRNADGYTAFNPGKCIGCNYCVKACPFQACKYRAEDKSISRCIFCPDRTAAGLPTACADHCPTGALYFGEQEEILTEARNRLAAYGKDYPNATLYGEDELGGLHYIYVFTDKPSAFGFPDKPTIPAGVVGWNSLVKPGGGVAAGALVVAAGGAALLSARARRMEKLQQEKESKKQ